MIACTIAKLKTMDMDSMDDAVKHCIEPTRQREQGGDRTRQRHDGTTPFHLTGLGANAETIYYIF
jgi:hypothetical protein